MGKIQRKRKGNDTLGNFKSVTKVVEFKATPIKCLYNSENFKIYSCETNSLIYPDIIVNKYGTVTIKGDVQELNLDCEYAVKANQLQDKYGISYQVINIKAEKPATFSSCKAFLKEILTYRQTEILLSVCPDIIDRIMNDRIDDIDFKKLKGIKEATFNAIRRKVIENFKLAELVDEFSGVFSFSIMKKLYSEYTSVEKIKENLHLNPYECLCKLGGVGFKTTDTLLLEVDEKSKERILKGEKPIINFGFDLISSEQRMKSCILYVLNENENAGNTYMSVQSLKKECLNYAPEAEDKFATVINTSDEIFFDKQTKTVAKIITYDTEKYIAEVLKLALLNSRVWEIDIEKYRKVDNSLLTDEQMQTMKSVCKNTITVLQGYGGTGKSFSILALINLLKDNNKSAVLLAPTGRAAKVLQKYTNHPASTIHRGLAFLPPNTWHYNQEQKLPYDIVILDETSMVDIYLFKHLLEAIDFTKTKLLLIGDNAQIPSVACGNLLHDILNSKIVPTVWLTKVFRYGKGGLSTVATDIREGKMTFENKLGIQVIGEDKSFNYIPVSPEKSVNYIIKMYQKMIASGVALKDILIVVAQNKGKYGTQTINAQIQSVINPCVSYSDKITVGDTEYRLGDPVIQCVNDYKSYIYEENFGYSEDNTVLIPNGDIGIITDIINNGIVVDFDDYRIYIPRDKFVNIKLAYAISIHKSQGGQARYVIIAAPNSHIFMLNANLLYVAVTRAKEKCYLLSDLGTYSKAIKKKENFARKTHLCDLLTQQ